MTDFHIRTSYAGIDNSDKEISKAIKIAESFKSLKYKYSTDKSIAFQLSAIDFAAFNRLCENNNIDWLIEC